MNSPLSREKAAEEVKRDHCYGPLEKWRDIQRTITWAESNLPIEKQRNRPRSHVPKAFLSDNMAAREGETPRSENIVP